MSYRPSPPLNLRDGDREVLESWLLSDSQRTARATRARIILLAEIGLPNQRIAELVSMNPATVATWRHRYFVHGIDGLTDRARPGRPRALSQEAIIHATLASPGPAPTWSTRLLGERLQISSSTVSRAWRAHGIRPLTAGWIEYRTAPTFVARVTDLCGLYLDGPDCAAVLRADTAAGTCGIPADDSPDHACPTIDTVGTDSASRTRSIDVIAALMRSPSGGRRVRPSTGDRHRSLLAFLSAVDAEPPADDHHSLAERHLVITDGAALRHPEVAAWRALRPWISIYAVESLELWLAMATVWHGIAERCEIDRNTVQISALRSAIDHRRAEDGAFGAAFSWHAGSPYNATGAPAGLASAAG